MLNLPTVTCLRCGHGTVPCPRCGQTKPWYPRGACRPGVCPCCKSAIWDRPAAPKPFSGSLIICPFCRATCPFSGDEDRPIPFAEQYGDFEVYRCACGALGSPSGDIGVAGWPLGEVEAALAAILESDRGTMQVTINYVTHTEPPLLLLWGKRR